MLRLTREALGIELLLFKRHGNAVRLGRTALQEIAGSEADKARGDRGDASSKN